MKKKTKNKEYIFQAHLLNIEVNDGIIDESLWL